MAKFTKGKWQWDEPSNWLGLEARVFVSEPYGVIAHVPIEAWRPKSIGRANAHLIAAAPAMYEALKNIENDDEHMPATAWKLIQDAIKLAEGGE